VARRYLSKVAVAVRHQHLAETFFLDALDVDPNTLRVERSPSLALARGRVGAVVGGYELGKLIRQSLVLGAPAVAAVYLLHFAHLSKCEHRYMR